MCSGVPGLEIESQYHYDLETASHYHYHYVELRNDCDLFHKRALEDCETIHKRYVTLRNALRNIT